MHRHNSNMSYTEARQKTIIILMHKTAVYYVMHRQQLHIAYNRTRDS